MPFTINFCSQSTKFWELWNTHSMEPEQFSEPNDYVLPADSGLNKKYCENPIIEGVMQSVVLEAADSLGIEHQSKHIDMDMISTATSMFFCNSLIGIWPIIRYKKNYKIHKYIKELQDIINKYYEY